jgi:signal transduction histidine kinase
MSWITVLWSVVAGICLALAGVHLLVWLWLRSAWVSLVFSLSAIAAAACALVELMLMQAASPEAFGALLRWVHPWTALMVVLLVWFIRLYLGEGRIWLAWLICAVRVVALGVNFAQSPNLNFREITGLRHVPFLGELVSLPVGAMSPWTSLTQLSLFLFLAYVVDASLSAWRRGNRRRAAVIGVTIAFATVLASVLAALMVRGLLPAPFSSLAYLLLVLVMSYELSRDVWKANQLSDELQKQRSELAHVQRASTLGLLASALAHELNHPLGAILLDAKSAELFLDRNPPDYEGVRGILADIRRHDERAGAVIERLRALLKRERLCPEPLSILNVVEEVVTLIHSEAHRRQVRLRTQSTPDLPLVLGDRIHLQQVLLNLVVNALRAMEEVPPEWRCLEICIRQSNQETVEVAVKDHGPGIPAEELDRIFEPFRTTKPDGLGVGLAISQRIIKSHGGRIWAENNAEGGASLRFTLRVTEGGKQGARAERHAGREEAMA